MTENKERIGSFTSSNIYKLMTSGRGEYGFGSGALTYINEKRIEKRLGNSLEIERYTRSMAWGIFMEMYVFKLIGMKYRIESKTTDRHPTIPNWSGSKDLIVKGEKVGDIKCYEPKNFCSYVDALKTGDLGIIKQKHPKEYWQLVSNAIINNVPNGEAIVFMPYKSELADVREMAENYVGDKVWQYRFIYESEDAELPYLPDNGYYHNLNVFEFIIPTTDIQELTERVLKANELLNR